MSPTGSVVLGGEPARARLWRDIFAAALPDVPVHLWPETGDPAAVRYLATWKPVDDLATRFPGLEVLFSTGAGIDQFDLVAVPPSVQVVRMVEPGITACMTEYVALATLLLHRDILLYGRRQRERVWAAGAVRPASSRSVGVMGLGVLGQAVLERLAPFGFRLRGWNRSARPLPGIEVFIGPEEFQPFLAGSDILVCLLPLTEETRGLIDAALLARLPRGAGLVNVGRGGHLVEADLLAALDSGQIAGAVLDVADPEPPPPDHPFWTHPGVLLTPHIASNTQPETSAQVLVDNVRRHRSGLPMIGVVDRARGY